MSTSKQRFMAAAIRVREVDEELRVKSERVARAEADVITWREKYVRERIAVNELKAELATVRSAARRQADDIVAMELRHEEDMHSAERIAQAQSKMTAQRQAAHSKAAQEQGDGVKADGLSARCEPAMR